MEAEEITSAQLEDYIAEGWKVTEGVFIRDGCLIVLRREEEATVVLVTNKIPVRT